MVNGMNGQVRVYKLAVSMVRNKVDNKAIAHDRPSLATTRM